MSWLTSLLLFELLSPVNAPPPTGLSLLSPEQLRGIPLASTPYSGVELPVKVDLASQMPPPGEQGLQNSCVGWATGYALKSYQEQVELNHSLTNPNGEPNPQHVFSPAFIYNQINNGRDGGASYMDALNLLSSQGAALWAEMPYDRKDHLRKPSADLRQKARRFRIDYWRQVNVFDLKELKAHLNAGYPVMIGSMIDTGFFQAKRGFVWSKPTGKSMGAHAMVLVGYDDQKQALKVMNSWGRQWADQGFGWISYRYFGKVAREAFVAKDAFNGPAPSTVQPLPPPPVSSDRPMPPPPVPTPVNTGASQPEKKQSPVPPANQQPEESLQPPESLVMDADGRSGPRVRIHAPEKDVFTRATDEAEKSDRQPVKPSKPDDTRSKELFSLQGDVAIPASSGRNWQVVVRFFSDQQGQPGEPVPGPVTGLYRQAIDGSLVATNSEQALPLVAVSRNWQVQLPADILPEGPFWIQVTLFIDKFGVFTTPAQRIVKE